MHRVDGGLGTRIAVHRWPGPAGASPPLILVHGFMGSVAAWGGLPARLARHRTVLVPELPGHGQSDAPTAPARYAVTELATSLSVAVRAIHDGPGDWLGYSMGGRVALAGVAEGTIQPRRLILESSSPGLAVPDERRARRSADEARAAALEAGGMTTFVDSWMNLSLFASQKTLPLEVREAEKRRRVGLDPSAMAACLRGGGTGSQSSYWNALHRLPRPTLLLTGALDTKFVALAERMCRRLQEGVHRSVDGAGHAVHLERPGDWLSAIEAFLGAAA